jgi:hypothetical protein
MDDAGPVRRGETIRDLHRHIKQLPNRKGGAMDVVAQRDAIDELRNNEGVALIGADVVNRQDIRMIQCARGSSFLPEPLLTVGVAHANAGEDLEGHVTLQPRIPRPKHFSHAASPDGRLDLVRPEACAGL